MYLINKISDEFLKEYAKNNLMWFVKKAVWNKYCYYICTLITIVCPVVSGLVFFMPVGNICSRLISEIILGVSTIAASMLPLFGYKKKWGMYRNQAEQIKTILVKYLQNKNQYDIITEIEKVKLKTHEKWMQPFNEK